MTAATAGVAAVLAREAAGVADCAAAGAGAGFALDDETDAPAGCAAPTDATGGLDNAGAPQETANQQKPPASNVAKCDLDMMEHP